MRLFLDASVLLAASGSGKGASRVLVTKAAAPGPGTHVCFAAPGRKAVDAFHAVALANGATDDGPPGVRANYDPKYYAAFVIDPDGHKIEAVTYRPD